MNLLEEINSAMNYMASGPIPMEAIDVTSSSIDNRQLVIEVHAGVDRLFSFKKSAAQLCSVVPSEFEPEALPDIVLLGVDRNDTRWVMNNPYPETMYDHVQDDRIIDAIKCSSSERKHGDIVKLEAYNPVSQGDILITELFAFHGEPNVITDWLFCDLKARSDEYMALISELHTLADYDFLPEDNEDFNRFVYMVARIPIFCPN